jgi:hypothetical protein
MFIRVGHENSIELSDKVFDDILSIYPEEELKLRPIFKEAFNNGFIVFKDLLKESECLYIPWQIFFLDKENLKIEKERIKKLRENKFSPKFFSKRKGAGKVTSKRIIDRLVRLQNFIVKNFELPDNNFCGLLRGRDVPECIKLMTNFFNIDLNFNSQTKEKALEYLIAQVELKKINVSRGVLKAGVLPEVSGVNKIYKNTSGFVIKDVKIPFIFLPDEINPDEVIGRRIYTLFYLLTCVGLNDYSFFLESEFVASSIKSTGLEKKKHDIVTGILLPHEVTSILDKANINKELILSIASRYKITPTAVVVTLRRRKIINSEEYDLLLPEPYELTNRRSGQGRRLKIHNAVEKFCGKVAFDAINQGISSKSLKSVEAQYLMFGRVKKIEYIKYCKSVGL